MAKYAQYGKRLKLMLAWEWLGDWATTKQQIRLCSGSVLN
jgi:hypothetical protein